jgi:peptidoglycan/LPS O-acetylase OafA/YrhL
MVGGIYLVLCLSFGLAAGVVGRIKGSSFALWFIIGAILPVLGLLAAVLYRYETAELRRECPQCGKVVMLYDALCTRCGTELDFPEVAIEPVDPTLRGGRSATV